MAINRQPLYLIPGRLYQLKVPLKDVYKGKYYSKGSIGMFLSRQDPYDIVFLLGDGKCTFTRSTVPQHYESWFIEL